MLDKLFEAISHSAVNGGGGTNSTYHQNHQTQKISTGYPLDEPHGHIISSVYKISTGHALDIVSGYL